MSLWNKKREETAQPESEPVPVSMILDSNSRYPEIDEAEMLKTLQDSRAAMDKKADDASAEAPWGLEQISKQTSIGEVSLGGAGAVRADFYSVEREVTTTPSTTTITSTPTTSTTTTTPNRPTTTTTTAPTTMPTTTTPSLS